MSNSLIVIPIDQQGMADYETDISKRDNLKEFDFPKNEVEFLFDKGIVDVLNDTFGIWIDEYEEEIIKNEFLKETEKIISEHKDKIPVFYSALKLAMEKDTEMCLEL